MYKCCGYQGELQKFQQENYWSGFKIGVEKK